MLHLRSFNESNSDLDIVNDIANIARDEGFIVDVKFEHIKYMLTIKGHHRKTSDIGWGTTDDHDKMIKLAINIRDRLRAHGFLDNSVIYWHGGNNRWLASSRHDGFDSFCEVYPKNYVRGVERVNFYLNV